MGKVHKCTQLWSLNMFDMNKTLHFKGDLLVERNDGLFFAEQKNNQKGLKIDNITVTTIGNPRNLYFYEWQLTNYSIMTLHIVVRNLSLKLRQINWW